MNSVGYLKSRKGFTLVELMVALAISVIVAYAAYSGYTYVYKTTVSQQMKNNLEQSARSTLDVIERDVTMAGYLGRIYTATPTDIKFSYSEDTYGMVMVEYTYDSTTKTLYRWQRADDGMPFDTSTDRTVIAQNVNSINFSYYDASNNDITGTPGAITTSPAYSTTIRSVGIQLAMQTNQPDPLSGQYDYVVLATRRYAQNLAEGGSANDTTPPPVPQGLQVRDTQNCSNPALKLTWFANNSTLDLQGYHIWYSTSSSGTQQEVSVPLDTPGFNPKSPSYTLKGLQLTPYWTASGGRKTNPNEYYISIDAYNTSMVSSNQCAQVSGNPFPDNTSFSITGNDSTVDAKEPAPPTGVSYLNSKTTAQAGNNQLLITWTKSPDATAGYRLYRNYTSFTKFPIDNADCIANENGAGGLPVLGPDATSYLDTLPASCNNYYYALCSVNCDQSLIYGNPNDQTTYPGYQQGQYTLSPAVFANTTAIPSDPNISQSIGGYKRVFINLKNPSDKNFDHTMLYWAKAPLTLNADGTVSSSDPGNPAQLVFNGDPSSEPRGEFCKPGLYSFVFNNETKWVSDYDTPSLYNNTTYYFMAVAFDKCGNHSAGGAKATTLATLCGDDPIGSPTPPTVTPTSSYNYDTGTENVTLNWLWAPMSDIDLFGYRVMRSNATFPTGTFLNTDLKPAGNYATGAPTANSSTWLAGPLWATVYTDTVANGADGSNAMDGNSYYYMVRATDCAWENITNPVPTGWTGASYDTVKQTNISYADSSIVGPINPGRLIHYNQQITHNPPQGTELYDFITTTQLDPLNLVTNGDNSTQETPYGYHNAVKFYLQNTSKSSIRLESLTLSWGNTAAYLKAVRVGGYPGSTAPLTYTLGTPAASGVVLNFSPGTMDLTDPNFRATNPGSPSQAIPVYLIFTNADGSISDATDMRGTIDPSTGVSSPMTMDMQLGYVLDYNGGFTVNGEQYLGTATTPDVINVQPGPVINNSYINAGSGWQMGFEIPGAVYPPNSTTETHPVAPGDRVVPVTANVSNTEQFTYYSNGTSSTVDAGIKAAQIAYTDTFQNASTAAGTWSTFPNISSSSSYIRNNNPPRDGMRTWYNFGYESATGNSTRLPSVDSGNFMYDTMNWNPCNYQPGAPTSLQYTKSGSSVNLTWNAPTQYTDLVTIDQTQDPLTYNVYKSASGSAPWTVQMNTSTTSASFSNVTTSAYYAVQAINSCKTNPKPSAYSNDVFVCVGSGSTLNVLPSAVTLDANFSTNKFTSATVSVTLNDCSKAGDGTAGEVVPLTISSPEETSTVNLTEIGDTGVFTLSGTYNGNNSITLTADSSLYDVSHTDAIQGALQNTMTSFSEPVTFTYGSGSTGATATVTVNKDPCSTGPGDVAGVSASRNGHYVTFTITPPAANTDGSTPVAVMGYQVTWGSNGSANIQSGGTINTGSGSKTTFYIRAYDSCNPAHFSPVAVSIYQ